MGGHAPRSVASMLVKLRKERRSLWVRACRRAGVGLVSGSVDAAGEI